MIVVWSTVAAVAVKRATQTIPVVFLTVGVPVEIRLVDSLSRPGGNITGVTFEAAMETYAKRLQLLKEAAPGVSRVALLHAVNDPNVRPAIQSVNRAGPVLGMHVQPIAVSNVSDIEPAFSRIKSQGADGPTPWRAVQEAAWRVMSREA